MLEAGGGLSNQPAGLDNYIGLITFGEKLVKSNIHLCQTVPEITHALSFRFYTSNLLFQSISEFVIDLDVNEIPFYIISFLM